MKNYIGQTFGLLTIIKEIPSKSKGRKFLCRCKCRGYKEATISNLQSGNTRSCGCLKRISNGNNSRKHGLSHNPLYKVWEGFNRRCNDPKHERYKDYGGRGIKVCQRWREDKGLVNFVNWAEQSGYREGLQLDRKDNNKGYSPTNCRWVTSKKNNGNKRNNVIIKYKGESLILMEFWAKYSKNGVGYKLAHERLLKGMTPIDAVSKPKKMFNSNKK